MLALLAETSVFVHLDPRAASVRVPPWFKNQPQLVLQIGLNMAVPIMDLDVGEQGISCTLSFSRRPFFCSIPWGAVFGLVGDNGPGLIWPDDVPSEIAAQVQAQTQAQVQKSQDQKPPVQVQKSAPGKPAAREAPRAKLRAVGSSVPTAVEPAAVETEETAKQAPAPQPLPALAPDQASPEASEASAEEKSPEAAPKPQPSLKPVQSNRPGVKRELPPYLRVVK